MCKDEIFENYLENEHPNYLHLLLSLPLGVIMLIIRCIFLRFMFKHVGKYFGVKEKLINAQQNEIPGNVYVSESMDYKMIAKLYKLIQWYRIVILQWLKQTRTLEKQHNLRNFNESSWTSFYATCSFTYGFFIFWNMPWLWDIEKCYFDYPFQVVTNDMWWYYTLNMAYYWSKIDINFFSKNTNYFLEFLFHDIVLLVYLHLTWYLNLVRLGIIVIFGMVFGDIIVGMKKMLLYTPYNVFLHIAYNILFHAWVLARNYIFAVYIVYGSIAAGCELIQITPTIILTYSLLVIIVIMDGVYSKYVWDYHIKPSL